MGDKPTKNDDKNKTDNEKYVLKNNYEIYTDPIIHSNWTISKILQHISSNQIVIPRIQRTFIWNREKILQLIESLFRGKIEIGELVFWRLNRGDPNTSEYRTFLENEINLHDWRLYILDGLQRLSAIAAIYLKEIITLHDKLKNIDIFYHVLNDEFKFGDEIKDADNFWINLKDTYNPFGINSNLKKLCVKKFVQISENLNAENHELFIRKIDSLYDMVNTEVNVGEFEGENANQAFDILISRNNNVEYSVLDFFDSVISNVAPKSKSLILEFVNHTKTIMNQNFFNVHDVLHLIIHFMQPGNYGKKKREIKLYRSNNKMGNITQIISNLTDKKEFSKFIESLNSAFIDLLPKDGIKKDEKRSLIITEFKTKSSFYACYCIFKFCEKKTENTTELFQFLAKYFIYLIIFKRYKLRENEMRKDLQILDNSYDLFDSLKQTMNENLDNLFWNEVLPNKLLEKKTRRSDLSRLYQYSQYSQKIFNSLRFTMHDYLIGQNEGHDWKEDKGNIKWIKIFHKEMIKKHCKEKFHYDSILNNVLIHYHKNHTIKKLARIKQPWGWLEEIASSRKDLKTQYVSPYFVAWNFPRNYEDEMITYEKKEKSDQKKEYFLKFFELRAKNISIQIKNIFFPELGDLSNDV